MNNIFQYILPISLVASLSFSQLRAQPTPVKITYVDTSQNPDGSWNIKTPATDTLNAEYKIAIPQNDEPSHIKVFHDKVGNRILEIIPKNEFKAEKFYYQPVQFQTLPLYAFELKITGSATNGKTSLYSLEKTTDTFKIEGDTLIYNKSNSQHEFIDENVGMLSQPIFCDRNKNSQHLIYAALLKDASILAVTTAPRTDRTDVEVYHLNSDGKINDLGPGFTARGYEVIEFHQNGKLMTLDTYDGRTVDEGLLNGQPVVLLGLDEIEDIKTRYSQAIKVGTKDPEIIRP